MMKQTQRKKSFTKEEVIAALKQCAKKLGRVPTYPELRKLSKGDSQRHSQAFWHAQPGLAHGRAGGGARGNYQQHERPF